MPLTKNRGEYIKVFRPTGTKYGQARDANLNTAIAQAIGNFVVEHGYVYAEADRLSHRGNWRDRTVDS